MKHWLYFSTNRKISTSALNWIADEDGFELEQELKKLVEDGQLPLSGRHGSPINKSLYDGVYAKEFNGLEEDFAIYLDGHSAVIWWHRFVARQSYSLQGWKRNPVYPDFVVFVEHGNRPQ